MAEGRASGLRSHWEPHPYPGPLPGHFHIFTELKSCLALWGWRLTTLNSDVARLCPHLGSSYSRKALEDSGIQIHSAFQKGSRVSNLNDWRLLNEYENMCPSSIHVSRVVNRHRGTVNTNSNTVTQAEGTGNRASHTVNTQEKLPLSRSPLFFPVHALQNFGFTI